ncbi:MAG: acyltransferase [Nocardiaceae bacterium]|nr:acyltransferase [Nocardiaceae bacterium]
MQLLVAPPAASAASHGLRTTRPSGYLPAVEGMRAVAAIGVLLTHTAFQTDAISWPVIGPLLGRLDLAVAVFFAISGYLLWRVHAAAARGLATPPSVRRYFRHRAVRILPAYWVAVCVVLLFVAGGSFEVWFANLTLTQLYFPFTLTTGLTQMWSLAVEVAFYVALPLIAIAMRPLRDDLAKLRAPIILGVSLASLGWAHFNLPLPQGVDPSSMPPAYLSWFGAGMLLAELSIGWPELVTRFMAKPWIFYVVAALTFCLSATPVAGAGGLVILETYEFSTKVALGAILAFALMAPVVASDRPHRFLDSRVMQTLGRWSYGIFIWHVGVLAIVLPVVAVAPFSGHFVLVTVVTLGLSILIAAASYALVEEPLRVASRRWERSHSGAPTAAAPVTATATRQRN